MRTENGGGDRLASGATRCQFRAAGSKVTQAQWDAIFNSEPEDEQKKDEIEEKS